MGRSESGLPSHWWLGYKVPRAEYIKRKVTRAMLGNSVPDEIDYHEPWCRKRELPVRFADKRLCTCDTDEQAIERCLYG